MVNKDVDIHSKLLQHMPVLIYKWECLSVFVIVSERPSEFAYLLPITPLPYCLSPRILNQCDPASALVHNSFASTVRWRVTL